MILVPVRCPQCESLYCGVWVCRFSGIANKDYAALQENRPDALRQEGANVIPAVAAPVTPL